ncbi:NAD P-binding protein [Gloeophyllum trabeum ATCC 11539]|uniref:NAD P-binding protein n=1 Tax=Gloeophyllum trabeum (strain ATCC 11539 / FP-39264 / Madison 617) TaxID=670483 RepID=S7Q7M5_GLOTA|nr:NAD P-binding protein [Gloeophyllum trabeum ATCC 11539]EPQ56006.1 NAD P-binding protein [Gloeophyllum trabeum ATCC 11539]
MSGYKNFAVTGAGNLGRFIIEELLKLQASGKVASVSVLTRSSNNDAHADLAKQGAKFVTVDYTSLSTLSSALSGVDVVISTLGSAALGEQQTALAQAAKESGVKLFVPSEFSNPSEGITVGILGVKNALHRKLEEIKLPYALFYTGPFGDYVFSPFFGWDFANGKVTILGEGSSKISFTTRRDIARFVAYVTTHLSPEQLHWKTFRIEGDRKTLNELVDLYQSRTAKKLDVTHKSRADLQAAVKANPQDFISWLSLQWDEGRGLVGDDDELSNKLFPDFNPTAVIDAVLSPEQK